MVSLIAKDIYNETIELQTSDSGIPFTFSNKGAKDVSQALGGFAYIENFTFEASLVDGISVTNNDPVDNDNCTFEFKPRLLFGPDDLDLLGLSSFTNVASGFAFGGDNTTVSGSNSGQFPGDSYVDTPLTLEVESRLTNGQFSMNDSGSVSFEVRLGVVGRQP